MSNFDKNWHIVSFKVNNRYWYMKQITFQDNAWALFSDIKLHAILLCCFSLGSPFESATFGPEFHPHSRIAIEKEKRRSANTVPQLKHKKKAYLFCSWTRTWVQLTHKKRANFCWRRRRWTKSQTEASWVPSCAMGCFPGALILNKTTFKILPNLPNKLT